MCVSGKIVEHVFRSTEWALGINHPVKPLQLVEQPVEVGRIVQMRKRSGQAKFLPAISLAQEQEELPAEALAEHLDGQKESASAENPAGGIGRNPPGGNQTMQMWVESHLLIPGVQHGQEAN